VADASTLLNVDLHTNDSILTASLLPTLSADNASRFDYAFKGSISDTSDLDYYKVRALSAAAGAPVMTVMGWGLATNGIAPRVSVFDATGRQVAANLLVNELGSFIVQVPSVVAGATYYVKVEAQARQGVGNYFLGVDFERIAAELTTFATGSLSAADAQEFYDLQVHRTVLYHFTLSAATADASIDSAIRVTIYDGRGNVIFTKVAQAGGDIVSGNLVLEPGKYKVRFSAAPRDKTRTPPLQYSLTGNMLDDPIGPQPQDSTTSPSGSGSTSPSSSTTSASSPQYSDPTWSGGAKPIGSPSDPYSDPYSGA